MRFILLAIVIFVIYRLYKGFKTTASPTGEADDAQAPASSGSSGPSDTHGGVEGDKKTISDEEDTVFDPVCSTYIPQSKALSEKDATGETYYFCSEECSQTFQLHMEDYVGKKDNGGKKGYPFF